jgi:hypothetical protein
MAVNAEILEKLTPVQRRTVEGLMRAADEAALKYSKAAKAAEDAHQTYVEEHNAIGLYLTAALELNAKIAEEDRLSVERGETLRKAFERKAS